MNRRLLWLVLVVSLVLVAVVGLSRVDPGDGTGRCDERVAVAAVKGLADDSSDPGYACTLASQERLFAVTAGLMGLVLISGLLSRRGGSPGEQ